MSWLFASSGQNIEATASVPPLNIQGWFPLWLAGLISFLSKGTLKSLLQPHILKASILWCSAFFMVQLSHPYLTFGKTICLPWWLRWLSVCLQWGRPGFDPWVRKIPWRRKWQSTPILLLGKFHGRRSLVGYRPCSREEVRHDWATSLSFFHTDLCWQSDGSLFKLLSRFVITFLPRNKHLLISWLQSPSAVILEPPEIKPVTVSTFLQYLPWSDGTRRHDLRCLNCEVKLLSCVWLFATLWTVACQAPPSMGFSRQEYWSGLPFPSPGDLPNPGIEPGSPALQADSLPSEPQGKSVHRVAKS